MNEEVSRTQQCPLCMAAKTSTFFAWPGFTVCECRACGFRFVDTSAAGYLPDAQDAGWDGELGEVRPGLPHILRRVSDIGQYLRAPGRALDIGCGKGELALALQAAGFSCVGTDLKPHLISKLQARFPQVEWCCSPAGALSAIPGKFDLVTLYHVLEHAPDPRAVLAGVKQLAKPGALVVVEVPNAGGWEARLKGHRWHYYKADHVSYFRVRDLVRLSAEAGFAVQGVRGYQHFSYPQGNAVKDSIKGVLGWLGFQDVISVFLRVR